MDNSKRNFLYTSLYQILTILIPLITTPYLSRVLGAEQLGRFSFSYSIAYYFMMFIKLGLDNYGNRSIAYVRDDKIKLSKIFCEIYLFQFVCACLFICLYFYYCILFTNNILNYILFIYVLSGLFDITWFFYGLEKFKLTVSRNIIVKIISTIAIFVLVKNKTNIYEYTLIVSISSLVSQLMVWPFLKSQIIITRVSFKSIVKHVKPNVILFIPVIAVSLYNIMDKIMLGSLSTKIQLGYYDSSEKVLQIPIALITALGTVMMPRMASMRATAQKKQINSVVGKSIEFAMFLSCGMAFGLMGVAKTFVPWYYGNSFEDCIMLFKVLLPSCIFLAFANVIRTQFLIPYEKDKIYIFGVISGALVNLFFNFLLIPKFQAIGASIGTLLAEITVCYVQAGLVKKELNKMIFCKKTIKYIISGIIMFTIIVHIDFNIFNTFLNLTLQVIIGCIIYLGLILLWVLISRRLLTSSKTLTSQNE